MVFDMTLFETDNRILIKMLKQDKCESAGQLLKDFSHRQWSEHKLQLIRFPTTWLVQTVITG